MCQARTNYALKALIEKYIQEHQIKSDDTHNAEPSIQEMEKIPIATIGNVELDSFTAEYAEDLMLI